MGYSRNERRIVSQVNKLEASFNKKLIIGIGIATFVAFGASLIANSL